MRKKKTSPTILVTKDNDTIYKGKIENLPFKDHAIKQKSMELFGDDAPCIIHQSVIFKHFAQDIISTFETHNETVLPLKAFEALDILDYDDDTLRFILNGGK